MKLEEALSLTSRRMRLARAVRVASLAFPAGCGFALLWSVTGRWVQAADPGLFALLVPAVLAALGLLLGFSWKRPDRFQAAVRLDRALDLREGASTSAYLAASGAEADLRAFVKDGVEARLAAFDRGKVTAALALPWRRKPALVGLLLLAVCGVALFLPAPAGGRLTAADDALKTAREQQRVREETRKLEKRSEEVERIAELLKLEEARKQARLLRAEARKLAAEPRSKRDALAGLSKLEKQLEETRTSLLGEDAEGRPFGLEEADWQRLANLTDRLDQLDSSRLDADLPAFQDALAEELAQAQADSREPAVDLEALEDLLQRAAETRAALDELKDLLARADRTQGEFAQLTERQIERLRRTQEALQRMDGY